MPGLTSTSVSKQAHLSQNKFPEDNLHWAVELQERTKTVEDFTKSSGSSSNTSRSSGARQLQQTHSSAEWQRGSGSISGSTVESALALFSGKKVLLVEVCDMVSCC